MIDQNTPSIALRCHSAEDCHIIIKTLLMVLETLRIVVEENSHLKLENACQKREISELKHINRELQWRVDPFSPDGDFVGNCNEDE
ncbi:MAG: hypothetical protein F6K22_31100 [Okeania sp. SIO2F4]|uniref:hypothetical protein n=1 Tax=Okeania sp. SIO2F4 TaxID=2607790 RepID=UPI00142C9502|nr:hypothetical protein [Okeania sp. SIO2F4]MDJ0516077.1 hypothetical protein [Trichodesmium sp. MO_231.B1]NES06872.1 hypothetical protein [Okeania sp. SIO2F4]